MMRNKTISQVGAAGIVLACLAFLLFAPPYKGHSRVIIEALNYGHLPLFGVIAIAFIPLTEKGCGRFRNYSLAFGFTILLGLAIEIIQLFMPDRFFELRDLLYDGLGAATFLAFVYPFPDNAIKRRVRFAMIGIIIASSTPLLLGLEDAYRMARAFPLIASFETHAEMRRWNAKESIVEQSHLHAADGEFSAKIILFPGKYPGYSTELFIGDWVGYTLISYDVFVTGDMPLYLSIRINDKHHNEAHSDRFNREFILSSGFNHIAISLREVALAPHGRLMDMHHITTFCIFSHNLQKTRTIFFDNLRLVKQDPNFSISSSNNDANLPTTDSAGMPQNQSPR